MSESEDLHGMLIRYERAAEEQAQKSKALGTNTEARWVHNFLMLTVRVSCAIRAAIPRGQDGDIF